MELKSVTSDLEIEISERGTSSSVEGKVAESRFRTHFQAMFLKRFNSARRDWKLLIIQALLPMLFMIFGMAILKNLTNDPLPYDFEISALPDGQTFITNLCNNGDGGSEFFNGFVGNLNTQLLNGMLIF